MTVANCSLCGKRGTGRIQGPAGTVTICRPCAVDVVPVLLAKSLHNPAGAARGVPGAAAAWALVSDAYFRMIARLAAPPAPAVHVRAADADPKLLHETSIEWAPGVDPAALVWCRERLVRNVYGRTGRPSLRYYRLLGWGNVSPAAPECGGMRNCFVRRMFFLTREDDPAAPKAATAIDPKTVRPGVFGTPIRAPLGEGPSH